MKKLITHTLVGFSSLLGIAQNETDAVNLSFQSVSGSARSMAMGGANIASGADLGAFNVNPAGLALIRNKGVSFTSEFSNRTIDTKFYENKKSSFKPKLNISSAGFGSPMDVQTSGLWKNVNFGVSYNRLTSFYGIERSSGINSQSSLLDVFFDQVTDDGYFHINNHPNNYAFTAGLAWDAFLIDTIDTDQGFAYVKAFDSKNQNQEIETITSGSNDEVNITFGGNHNNKLYIGGSVGIAMYDYTKTESITENVNSSDTLTNLKHFTYNRDLQTTGGGVNLKLGLIYRANDFFRIGGYFHSPTYYNLEDKWSSSISASYEGFEDFNYESNNGLYNYSYLTPLKAGAGVTFLFNKMGLLSVDYDYIDYGMGRFRSVSQNSYDFSSENTLVKNALTKGSNLRLGTEWRFGKFYTRGGFAYYSNAYKDNQTANNGFQTTTFGIGLKGNNAFMDLTFTGTKHNTNHTYLYNPTGQIEIQATEINQYDFNLMLSVGFKL